VLPRSSRGSGTHCGWVPAPRWVTRLRWTIRLWRMPALAVVMGLSLSGCSGGGAPAPTAPSRPSQAAAAKPAAPAPAPKPAAPPYVYETKGRRDPFRPLIAPRVAEVKPRPKTGLAALEVSELKLSGIIWEQRGFFALVEAPNGAGYVLRVSDPVGENARVTNITPQGVTFEVKAGGTPSQPARGRMVELRLRKEE
jgi:Tfp pilus assembly protein PilP